MAVETRRWVGSIENEDKSYLHYSELQADTTDLPLAVMVSSRGFETILSLSPESLLKFPEKRPAIHANRMHNFWFQTIAALGDAPQDVLIADFVLTKMKPNNQLIAQIKCTSNYASTYICRSLEGVIPLMIVRIS